MGDDEDKFVVIPLDDDGDDDDDDDGLCFARSTGTTGFMNMFYRAYESDQPLEALRGGLKRMKGCHMSWKRVRHLMTLVKWSQPERDDPEHPMAFVVDDVKKLRGERFADEITEEARDNMLWKFCYYATCMPQIWCSTVLPPSAETLSSTAFMLKHGRPCAYLAPNLPVPWVWFNANGHCNLDMHAHNMKGIYGRKTLRVAIYRRERLGVINTLHPDFIFNTEVEVDAPTATLHATVDTSKAYMNVITARILRAVPGWTFMIFLTEGSDYRFISATLNDGGTPTTLHRYPVVVHTNPQGK